MNTMKQMVPKEQATLSPTVLHIFTPEPGGNEHTNK